VDQLFFIGHANGIGQGQREKYHDLVLQPNRPNPMQDIADKVAQTKEDENDGDATNDGPVLGTPDGFDILNKRLQHGHAPV
jgi:hypothetical protein